MPSLHNERDLIVDGLVGVEGQPVQEVQHHGRVVAEVARDGDEVRRWEEADQQRVVAPVVTWEGVGWNYALQLLPAVSPGRNDTRGIARKTIACVIPNKL